MKAVYINWILCRCDIFLIDWSEYNPCPTGNYTYYFVYSAGIYYLSVLRKIYITKPYTLSKDFITKPIKAMYT